MRRWDTSLCLQLNVIMRHNARFIRAENACGAEECWNEERTAEVTSENAAQCL